MYISSFSTENIFQFLFLQYRQFQDSLRRSFTLGEEWILQNRDEINVFLNFGKRHPVIEADAGFRDQANRVLPIELETLLNYYTLVQVPAYCHRARLHTYNTRRSREIVDIKALVVCIAADRFYVDALQGPMCSVRALYAPRMTGVELDIRADEHPVFFYLQELLRSWNQKTFADLLRSEQILDIGKVFISCWLTILGDEANMAEIKEAIETHFGSEEEFVKRAVSGAGKSFVEFLTPEQIESLTPEQIESLTPEQIERLTPEQAKYLKPEQLRNVPREVLLRALEMQEKE